MIKVQNCAQSRASYNRSDSAVVVLCVQSAQHADCSSDFAPEWRNGHAARTRVAQQLRPRFVKHWATVMNKELGVAKKAIERMNKIASHLLRPIAVWVNTNASNVNGPRFDLNDQITRCLTVPNTPNFSAQKKSQE